MSVDQNEHDKALKGKPEVTMVRHALNTLSNIGFAEGYNIVIVHNASKGTLNIKGVGPGPRKF